ncbi:MAG TPA: hypothetical protein VG498_06030 [Terriglobales bacterium]|nr:hypothetical protein [Terriglobales bacterium]
MSSAAWCWWRKQTACTANRTDALRVEQLEQERDIEVRRAKENTVIGKDSRSQVRFTHDVHVAVAKFYSENLREEVSLTRDSTGPGFIRRALFLGLGSEEMGDLARDTVDRSDAALHRLQIRAIARRAIRNQRSWDQ